MNAVSARLRAGRRLWLAAGVAGAWATVGGPGLAGCAAVDEPSGPDHLLLDPPVPVAAGPEIEVVEFYWFGCPHCADMHPRVSAWRARQAGDVRFRMEPALLREEWHTGARLHHTLLTLGVLDRLAGSVFEAVQGDLLDLSDEAQVEAWAAMAGLDRETFARVYRSVEVGARVRQSADDTRRHGVRGVPAFIVDGRRLTSNGLSGSPAETLVVLDRLVAQARQERRAAR
jgi:thiol:disulfide interchange protein DsbA